MDDDTVLPSAGPRPLPLDTAVAAVLGYARGRRPLYFRAPNARTGRWVEIPAFGYERFDARPGSRVDPRPVVQRVEDPLLQILHEEMEVARICCTPRTPRE